MTQEEAEKVLKGGVVYNQYTSSEKYTNNSEQTPIRNLYDIHKEHSEDIPEDYKGARTIKGVLSYLGSKDGKEAKIDTPVEQVTFNKNNISHLLNDNEKERLNGLNKVIRTLINPNIVIHTKENDSEFNYYIKLFRSEKGKSKPYLQIIKCKDDGNFYVTNYSLNNNKFKSLLKNGQIIYDLTDHNSRANAPVNNSINDIAENFNPDIKTYEQLTTNTKEYNRCVNVWNVRIQK